MGFFEPLASHAAPFVLVMFRLLGVFVFTPLMSGSSLPRQVKVMVALAFTAAVYPALPPPAGAMPGLDLVELAPLMLTEAMIGAVIGMLASLPRVFQQMAGYIMGYQMGFALAQAYNPHLDAESDALGQLLYYLGMAAFVAIGGLDAVFMALLSTFESVPVGAFATDMMPLDLLVALLGSGFEFAMRLASPVLGVVIMILISMGFVMKTMPQINVMSVGFTAKIVAGLLTLASVIVVIDAVSVEEIRRVMAIVLEWAAVPQGGAGA